MKDIKDIKFNLTPEMADKIVKINDLKVKVYEIDKQIKEMNEEIKNLKLINRKEEIIKKMDSFKKDFIREFQSNNKEQINKYLDFKNKKD